MEFFVFLTLTAFAVSVDRMIAGFAIGLKTKKTCFFAFIVATETCLLCIFATLLAMIATEQYHAIFKIAGALFLIVIGIANLVKRHKETPSNICFKEFMAIGFAVGIDAGIANFSLYLLGYTQLFVPFLFAITHFATISAGAKIANTKLTNKLKNTNKISGLILFCLGLFKLFN